MLLLCIVILEFLSKVATGASLDIFDMNILDKMDFSNNNSLLNQIQLNTTVIEPPSDSHIVNYFSKNIFKIMEIREDHVFTSIFNYKSTFIKKLQSESFNINNVFENYKSSHILTLNSR